MTQNNFAAASVPAKAETVYRKDEYGRFIPIEPVVSAVDINVCRVQTVPAVQGLVTTVWNTSRVSRAVIRILRRSERRHWCHTCTTPRHSGPERRSSCRQ